MGLLQFGMGMSFLVRDTALPALRRGYVAARAGVRRGALATGEWRTAPAPNHALAVDFVSPRTAVAGVVSPGPATLHRAHVGQWRTRALASEHRLAQLTSRWYALLREYGMGPHPVASAMFRHHSQGSLLDLVGPNLLAFDHRHATAPELQILALLREQLADHGEPPTRRRATA